MPEYIYQCGQCGFVKTMQYGMQDDIPAGINADHHGCKSLVLARVYSVPNLNNVNARFKTRSKHDTRR